VGSFDADKQSFRRRAWITAYPETTRYGRVADNPPRGRWDPGLSLQIRIGQDKGSIQLLLEVTAKNAVASCSTCLLRQYGQETASFSCSARVMIFSNVLLQSLQM
jgi:hypothetical protein